MRHLITKPLVTVGDRDWTYGHAVLAGLLVGEWTELEARVITGLALEREGAEPEAEALSAATVAFRRERRLLAAQDMRIWMEERDLDVSEVDGVLRRAVLRDAAAPDRLPVLAAGELEDHLRAEAFVDGTLARCAEALVARAGALDAAETIPAVDGARLEALPRVADERGLGPELAGCAEAILAADAAHARAVALATGEERLARRLRERRLALTRVRYDEIRLTSVHAAREAALCVRVDGMGLPQVAARAGVGCAPHDLTVQEVEGALSGPLAGARPGEAVGPVSEGEVWRLAVLRDRTPPALADPAVRERLVGELSEDVLRRRTAGRVTWHGHV